MRTWNLKAGDPLSLTLAADARLVATDYYNDHIWELALTGGDPPAIAIQTTFGLRARSFRMFPRFSEAGVSLSDPASFNRPPAVQLFSVNFVRFSFAPFVDIDIISEYWAPESHAVSGRMKITNQGVTNRTIRFEWAAVLNPTTTGQRLSPSEIGSVKVLAGQTDELFPVIFLTGGAELITSPYSALGLELDLPKETTRILIWAEAALGDAGASFNMARQVAARNWEAESARIELINAGQVEIYTGEVEWDAAFALAQKNASGLFCGPTPALPAVSFVSTRQPDYGYSPRGDGSDYNHLWNGQSPLDACYLAGFLLPTFPQLLQGVVQNYLSTQGNPGELDWKPGMGGQRSQLLATPVLTGLVWNIYQVTLDKAFLEAVFPSLLSYFLTWFDTQHDRDGDGVPEWDHVLQTGFEDHPLFTHWDNWSRGIDITTVESPALCAFLYHECRALIQIARLLERTEPMLALQAHADNLKAAVEVSWDEKTAVYHYWDRDTHTSPTGETLGERYGSGEVAIRRNFDQPVRTLVRIQSLGEPSRQVQIFIHGTSPSGQHLIERISSEGIHWYLGLGSATSERIYANLERVEIQGVNEQDRLTLQTVGYECVDLTVLLPIWAGIPSLERARILVEKTITAIDGFWQPKGVIACANVPATGDVSLPCQSIHMPWNTVIGEGLVDYGYREQAAELVTRLMSAVVVSLKRDQAFRRFYHAQTGAGIGERDALAGLAPLGLFLYTLGVKLFSPTRVEISGFNPFPWPVTVKYRGLTILRQIEKTTIIFPDGQAVTLEGSESRTVALE